MAPTAKNYCFTSYKDESPNFDETKCQFLCFQRETCPETGRLHWQGFVSARKRVTLRVIQRLLGDATCHVAICKGTPQENYDYCSKGESGVEGSFREFGVLPAGKGERCDLKDFVAAFTADPQLDLFTLYPEIIAKYPRFINDLRHDIYRKRYDAQELDLLPVAEWAVNLCGVLAGAVDHRTVHWYVDVTGGAGKSTFARAWRGADGGQGYIVNGGKHSDIYYGYGYERVVFFDWSRDHADSMPYSVIENFKNGYFLSTKYEVRKIYFNSVHVVVFSNFEPDIAKLSFDRWNIIRL